MPAGSTKLYGLDPSLTSSGFSDGVIHTLIKTKPSNDLSPLADLQRRIDAIFYCIQELIDVTQDWIMYVEAPMLNGAQANHLYEVGAFNISLHRVFGEANLRWVTPSTLKKFITGKGNAPKKHDPAKCGVGKKPLCVTCGARVLHGMAFEKDPGQDKLHAWGLQAYGCAVTRGDIEYVPIARRGQGKVKVGQRTAAANRKARQLNAHTEELSSTRKSRGRA